MRNFAEKRPNYVRTHLEEYFNLQKQNTITLQTANAIGGGFEIPQENIKIISLAQIVTAIDGDSIFTSCGLGINHCSETHPCPLNKRFKSIREDLSKMLENTYLEELVLDVSSGDSFLM